MSHAKFAAVTASLLARKGEAAPWEDPWRKPPLRRAEVAPVPVDAPPPPPPPPVFRPALAAPPPPPDLAKMHKYALHMTAGDYEKLGLIAVKHGSSRQQLMQQALADFLAVQAREYGGACACLGSCGMGCGEAAADHAAAGH